MEQFTTTYTSQDFRLRLNLLNSRATAARLQMLDRTDAQSRSLLKHLDDHIVPQIEVFTTNMDCCQYVTPPPIQLEALATQCREFVRLSKSV